MNASEDELRLLMSRGLNGDAAAHEQLLRSLAPVLRSYFGRRVHDAAHEVDDMVQETLIAIHTRRMSYDRVRPFMPWAYAIARYKMVDHFRRRGASIAVDELEEWHAAESFEEASSARLDVDRLLSGLPDKQQAAIRSTKIDGASVAETAANQGLSEADVKVSVHRGLKALAAKARER